MNNQNEFRHHVAQAYLKGFKEEKTPLFCYKDNSISEIGLKNDLLGEMNFYTNNVEEFLNYFETKFANYRDYPEKELQNKINENSEEFSSIVSLFFLRSKYQKNFWKNQMQKVIENNILLPIDVSDLPIQFFENQGKNYYLSPKGMPEKVIDDIEQKTFENEIFSTNNNKITEFIEKCIIEKKYEITTGKNFITSETPVIILDENNNFIRLSSHQKISNLLFTLNSNTRLYFYGEIQHSMPDSDELFKELLDEKYCEFLISGDKNKLEALIKKIL